MAKIKHHDPLETVNRIVSTSRAKGVTHLVFDGSEWTGRHLELEGRRALNLGTCGYLALETDPRLIERSVEYTRSWGTQFSISRAYVVSDQVRQLEQQLSRMFGGQRTLVYSSTTITHISVLPIVVGSEDAIVLDRQVHFCVQNAAQLMVPRGIRLRRLRHSDLSMLEQMLQEMSSTQPKVWYMIDGVYSMYGDLAPYAELNALMDRYPALHLYIDDAHGMGWCGPRGSGSAWAALKHRDRVVLTTTLAKGFGCIGGVAVLPDEATYSRIQTFGGPLGYSHPLPPATLGAAQAASEIMLSDEVNRLQAELRDRQRLCQELLAQTDLPVLSDPRTPIGYVGAGHPSVGDNLFLRLLKEGFYTSVGMFPAVPMQNAGIRFTLTRHQSSDDIRAFVAALAHHHPLALADEGVCLEEVRRAFGLEDGRTTAPAAPTQSSLKLEMYRTAQDIDPGVWDALFDDGESYDHAFMCALEEAVAGHEDPVDNWSWFYVFVRDAAGQVVVATYGSVTWLKDDMLSPASVSRKLEAMRVDDPLHLCSKALVLGSTFSEGRHLVYEADHPQLSAALKSLLGVLEQLRQQEDANTILLRDFDEADDARLASVFYDHGYGWVQMPNSNIIDNVSRAPGQAQPRHQPVHLPTCGL